MCLLVDNCESNNSDQCECAFCGLVDVGFIFIVRQLHNIISVISTQIICSCAHDVCPCFFFFFLFGFLVFSKWHPLFFCRASREAWAELDQSAFQRHFLERHDSYTAPWVMLSNYTALELADQSLTASVRIHAAALSLCSSLSTQTDVML